MVRITSGSWRRCILSVHATSTNPNAILTLVSTATGSEFFRLDNLGNGNYSGTRAWRPPGTNVPVSLTVRGSATRIRTWNLPVNSRPLYR